MPEREREREGIEDNERNPRRGLQGRQQRQHSEHPACPMPTVGLPVAVGEGLRRALSPPHPFWVHDVAASLRMLNSGSFFVLIYCLRRHPVTPFNSHLKQRSAPRIEANCPKLVAIA